MAESRVGLDLRDARTVELVRRIYYGRLVVLAQAESLDAEEGFQELYLGLLRRQERPRSRYVPTRSSLSTYLLRAGRSSLLDWVRAQRRAKLRNGVVGAARDAALDAP